MRKFRRISVPALVMTVAITLLLVLQIPAIAASFQEYTVPTDPSFPYSIASGPDGALWFTETATNKIGRCTPSGSFTEYGVPTLVSGPKGITAGPDGALWFTEWIGNKIGRCTTTGTFTEYNIPTVSSGPWSIAAGSDGALWFTENNANKIGRCTTTGTFTEYDVPTANSQPFGIVAGSDGALWFTEWTGNKIGRCTTAGTITEYKIPTANAGPKWITVGPDGALWFTEWTGNKIGRCTTVGAITESDVPTANSKPAGITTGSDGALWFAEASNANKIGRCSTTGKVTNEYKITTANAGTSEVTMGPDGRLWFCEWGRNKIGSMTLPTPVWYLAEGTSAWGFNTYINIMNPNNTSEQAQVTYMTPTGQVLRPVLNLAPLSQTSIDPRMDLGYNTDFSTKVECLSGDTIAADRTMYWTGPGAASPEAHASIGVTCPERTWYLAEGCSSYGFETWLLIQNPNSQEAKVKVTYMTEGWGAQSFDKKVPANSRATFNMQDDIGQQNASIKVDSDIPVIPERSMYRNNRREGSDSIGTYAPAVSYYGAGKGQGAAERTASSFLAEGSTENGFITYILVQNPNNSPATVTLTYMTTTGPVPQAPFTMPANSRQTIRVNYVLPNADFSTQVASNKPIVAERAMYWDLGQGEACHDSIGLANAHTTYYFPDGQSSNGWETFTLVGNPNDTPVNVEVTYMKQNGQGTETVSQDIAAKSRATFNMVDKLKDGRASIMVTCKTKGKKVTAERSMYWNNRGAGTCTIGGFSD